MPLVLSLRPTSPSVLADGPMPFSLTIENTGPFDATAPAMGGSSPFEYSVYAGDGSRWILSASASSRQAADRWMDDMPPIGAGDLTLSPGAAAVYDDDLMSLLTEPLAPGSYLVQASYGASTGETTVSARVPLVVVASRPLAIAQDLALREGRVVVAEWHSREDGKTLLRARQSGNVPLGRFSELTTIETGEPVRQVALSCDVAYRIPEGWRWLAWLDGGSLFAGVAQEQNLLFPTQPIALDLEAPTLLPFGFTTADRGAIFVVAGKREGRQSILLIRIPSGPNATPLLTDVRLSDPPDVAPIAATCVWTAEGVPALVLSWVQEIKGVSLILQGRVDATTGEVLAPPKGVFVTLRSVLATSFPPTLGPDERRHAQVLLGPEPNEGASLTHMTFEMTHPSTQTSRELPPLSVGEVARWVLPSDPTSGAPLLAVAGGEIWASGSQGWTRIATGDVEPSSARLWVFSAGRWLATWFDREGGYRSRWIGT
jgi:hypothetical protein